MQTTHIHESKCSFRQPVRSGQPKAGEANANAGRFEKAVDTADASRLSGAGCSEAVYGGTVSAENRQGKVLRFFDLSPGKEGGEKN